MSTSSLRAIFRVVVTFLAIGIVSVPMAEVAFRLCGDEPSSDLGGLFVQFKGDNYKLGSLVNTDAFRASGHLFVYTDQLGLRCDAARRFGVRPGDSIDVLLVGDSQGFGNEVNFEQTVPGTLAQMESRRGIRVANAAVGGHTLNSQLQLVRWLVEDNNVKVSNIVLLLTPALINSGLELNHARVGPDGRLYGGTVTIRMRVTQWIKTHSVVYSRLRDAVRNLGIGVDPQKRSPVVFDFYEDGEREHQNADTLVLNISRFKDFADRHDASLHLVYLPLTVEVDFEPVKNAAASARRVLDPDLPLRMCNRAAEQAHVPIYNLKPVLETVRGQGYRLNVKADFHYSAVLSQSCGAFLASQLQIYPRKNRLVASGTGD